MPYQGPNSVVGQGFPGSPDPYYPVNPWGRKPDFTRAKTVKPVGNRDLRHSMSVPLYQVMVDDERGEPQPIGPAMQKDVVALRVFPSITKLMISGKLKGWSNPRIELATVPVVNGASGLIGI